MFSKDESDEIKEQMSQMIDMLVITGEELYTKLSENPTLFAALAKCVKTMVDELMKADFTRSEALAIATNYLSSMNTKK